MTVLAITVGVALSGGIRLPSGPPVASWPQASASSQASPPSPAGFRLETGDAQAIQRTLDQLQKALEQALAEVAPDARWIYMPDVPGEKPLPNDHPAMHAETGDRVGFAARSGVSRQGAKAGFYLWLRPDGCSSRDGGPSVCSVVLKCTASSTPADCTSSTTPDGLSIVEATETGPAKGGKDYRFYVVQVGLPNDYHLTLKAVNYFGGDRSGITVQAPLLTKAELKAVALAVAGRISG